ncbi:tRNA1(Val) (adenine(37)-N6)-methyltransferase [Hymenobacter chitinivorans]|uniref:tRNA1(Val) (adenine(37)-N6)-methyltransferase n=1 Tax=Hymenobacter chitinivorans DSM 11115 TaxID=1121954 RepID=A0A2M9BQA0_9BACT|nr:methyltransferase [Hymenobacter chitinivorans]PJJ60126.1 tRNA1Val (adenine37-N6)-methyltransferase [Hymenobacter chitinivorans DSM 11115]
MANTYFRFKHFTIDQAECAMKVCTDACVLGAAAELTTATRILDIGTGTGLLALMAAQRNPTARIDAVEVEPQAAAQAAANVAGSPWSGRVQVLAGSLAALAATEPAAYDHILCNPPFFRESLRSPSAARTTARHTAPDTLTFQELAEFASRFLAPGGQLSVLLPPPEMQHFEREAAHAGLFAQRRLVLSHRPGSKPLRHITHFGHQSRAVEQQPLAIHEAESEAYSAEFEALLRDFYLAF